MGAAGRLPALGLGCAALAWRAAAQADASAGLMCQCELQDNNWLYYMGDILTHVQDLPQALQDPEHPSTGWVMRQRCAEDASTLPNTETALDIGEVLRLRDGALRQGVGSQELQSLCLPGQVALAMVCTQQWLVKGSLMGIIKWAGRMAELLGVAMDCMDSHSPLPLRRADFERYVAVFQQGIAKPDTPGFLAAFAFPFNARRKEYSEAAAPLHECLPLLDASCFPRGTLNALESCLLCCSPQMGPGGNPACWDGGFTYARCCHAASPAPPAAGLGDSGAVQGQCRDQDERNRELQASLEEQVAAVQEQGRAISSLREELRVCGERRDEEAIASLKEEQVRAIASLKEEQGRAISGLEEEHGRAISGLKEELRVCAEERDRERKSSAEAEAKSAALLLDAKHAQEAKAASSAVRDQCARKVEEAQAEATALKKDVGDLRSKLDAGAKAAASSAKQLEEQRVLQEKLARQVDSLRAELEKARAAPASRPPPKKGGKAPACADRNELCGEWAESGMCQESPEYMFDQCAKACKMC